MRYVLVGRTVNDAAFGNSFPVHAFYNGNGHIKLQMRDDVHNVPVDGKSVGGKYNTKRDLSPIVKRYQGSFDHNLGGVGNVERVLWQNGSLGIKTHVIDESNLEFDSSNPGRSLVSLEGCVRPWHIVYRDSEEGERTIIKRKLNSDPDLDYLTKNLKDPNVILLTSTISQGIARQTLYFAEENNTPLYTGGITRHEGIIDQAMGLGTVLLNLEELAKLKGDEIGGSYEEVTEASMEYLKEFPENQFPIHISAGKHGNGGRFQFNGDMWWFHIKPEERIREVTDENTKKDAMLTNGLGDSLLSYIALERYNIQGARTQQPLDYVSAVKDADELLRRARLDRIYMYPIRNALIASIAIVRKLGFADEIKKDDFSIDTIQLD